MRYLWRKLFSSHLQSSHGIDIQTKDLLFENYEKFKSFLKKIQQETCSNYSTKNIIRNTDQQVTYENFICSTRGGSRRSSKKSTIKIGNICPAQISIFRNNNDGSYRIKWITTHVGHGKLWINDSEIIEKDDDDNNKSTTTTTTPNNDGKQQFQINDFVEDALD
ncbi:hypothetical protein BLA29_010192 [Euroglyphus maynei]|uniref:Uncharacterized protein n=1 Tax=Euroglyphus maynei TaxID=6958 RepID=A0A1Y3B875_EURMA|nr:hypothetical protein BLA29_010192 [Euroglyphus maynei]